MKRLFSFLIVLIVVSACAPMAQGFVDLPPEQEVAITGIVTALFALLLDFMIGVVPWLSFFKQYQEAWSLSLSVLTVQALENALPTGSDAIAVPAVGLFIAVALYLLARTIFKRNGVRGFV